MSDIPENVKEAWKSASEAAKNGRPPGPEEDIAKWYEEHAPKGGRESPLRKPVEWNKLRPGNNGGLVQDGTDS